VYGVEGGMSSKRKMGATGIELSVTGFLLFVVALRALQLSIHCLSLRSIFSLNMLALLDIEVDDLMYSFSSMSI
jgi:hypothetical protein